MQSSTSVFVIVEGNKRPYFRATLKDVNGSVSRAGKTAELVVKNVTGGAAEIIALEWDDPPSNTRVVHAWVDETLLPVGVYTGEIPTDPNGDDEWTFPTEASDLFTLVVRARLGAP